MTFWLAWKNVLKWMVIILMNTEVFICTNFFGVYLCIYLLDLCNDKNLKARAPVSFCVILWYVILLLVILREKKWLTLYCCMLTHFFILYFNHLNMLCRAPLNTCRYVKCVAVLVLCCIPVHCCVFVSIPQLKAWGSPGTGWEGSVCNRFPILLLIAIHTCFFFSAKTLRFTQHLVRRWCVQPFPHITCTYCHTYVFSQLKLWGSRSIGWEGGVCNRFPI